MNALARMAFVFFLVALLILGSGAAVNHPTPDMWFVLVGLLVATYGAYVAVCVTGRAAR